MFEQRKAKWCRVPHRVRVLYLVKVGTFVSCRDSDVSYSSQTSHPPFEFRDAVIDFLSCG